MSELFGDPCPTGEHGRCCRACDHDFPDADCVCCELAPPADKPLGGDGSDCIVCGANGTHLYEGSVYCGSCYERDGSTRPPAGKSEPDDYVAWCRYQGSDESRRIVTCDSDDLGAFKVYRHYPARELQELLPCGHRKTNLRPDAAGKLVCEMCEARTTFSREIEQKEPCGHRRANVVGDEGGTPYCEVCEADLRGRLEELSRDWDPIPKTRQHDDWVIWAFTQDQKARARMAELKTRALAPSLAQPDGTKSGPT
jgi:hypothetical protein